LGGAAVSGCEEGRTGCEAVVSSDVGEEGGGEEGEGDLCALFLLRDEDFG
jgi:hypothetical protein